MANDATKQPLLSGSVNPNLSANGKYPLKKRRFRRCRSAPGAEYIPERVTDNPSPSPSQSLLINIHPSFKKVFIFLALYLGIGTLCFSLFKNQISGQKTDGVLDAVYFCIVTMTTVGYGDLVPDSNFAKLLACAFVFAGMSIVGLVLSKGADYLVEKQEILVIRTLHMREKVGEVQILKEIEANKVRYKCIVVFVLLLMLIATGTAFLVMVEKLEFVDAFYCVCSTITTLGYGDKSFSTQGGRIFAIFWILTSTVCVAQFFLYVAELNTETRQRALAKFVLSKRVTNVDLEAADIDNDGVVGAAEFVLYKLKEMGKINQEDISLVMQEFENLDIDDSGTLSASDIMLAQSSQT